MYWSALKHKPWIKSLNLEFKFYSCCFSFSIWIYYLMHFKIKVICYGIFKNTTHFNQYHNFNIDSFCSKCTRVCHI